MNVSASIWKTAEHAVVTGNVLALERLLLDHGALLRKEPPPSSLCGGLTPDFSGAEARGIIVSEHHFKNWPAFAAHLEALEQSDSIVAQFEAAVDALVAGDVETLKRGLQRSPELIRTRSTRQHRATLLLYVGANGVERWRQKTPPNAVLVTEILLKAGAEVDAVGDMYGGSTTLGLVATSIHPLLAGVQNELMEVLLAHGAAFEVAVAPNYTSGSVINACLANGRPGAAEFLACRGARLDLEGAAGVGRMDVVESFFNVDGDLKAPATPAQMKSGFQWACEYGRTNVVEFLLRRGIEVGEMHRGQTGLHWAAYGGHVDIVRMLLERKAPVSMRDESWKNTPLGWALYGWSNPPSEGKSAHYYEVVTLLVAAGSPVEPEWISGEKVLADPRMLAALSRIHSVQPRMDTNPHE